MAAAWLMSHTQSLYIGRGCPVASSSELQEDRSGHTALSDPPGGQAAEHARWVPNFANTRAAKPASVQSRRNMPLSMAWPHMYRMGRNTSSCTGEAPTVETLGAPRHAGAPGRRSPGCARGELPLSQPDWSRDARDAGARAWRSGRPSRAELARRSGFKGVVDLMKTAKHGRGERVFLIEFHYED